MHEWPYFLVLSISCPPIFELPTVEKSWGPIHYYAANKKLYGYTELCEMSKPKKIIQNSEKRGQRDGRRGSKRLKRGIKEMEKRGQRDGKKRYKNLRKMK